MAISYNINTNDAISLDEFINKISKKINPEREESLIECVEDIQKLSNNKEFIINQLHKELLNIESFISNNNYSAQSNIIFNNNLFYLRINIWEPLSEKEEERQRQNKLFFYGLAHDHNFPFLTVGYHGKGYETEMWEYNYDRTIGYIGEKVDMCFLERTTLPLGKAMIYRMSKDIHTQFAPESYSISLNLIPKIKKSIMNEQFFFDTNKKIITGITSNEGAGRHFLLNLAGAYGNTTTLNLVENIAFNHEIPFIRIKAFEAMTKLTGNKKDIWELAIRKDKNKLVTTYAKKNLNSEME